MPLDFLGSSAAALNFIDAKAKHGAKGDGTTDDTAALNAATSAANAAGGGIVFVPAGTYVTQAVVLYPKVRLVGAGVGITTLQLKAGSTANLVETTGFSTLATGTGNATTPLADVPYQFGIENMSLDGNKANCPSGGRGIAFCGYEFRIADVHVHHCKSDGVYHEFIGADIEHRNNVNFCESFVTRVKTMDNDGHGYWDFGPHDSMVSHVNSARNGATSNTKCGFRVEGLGNHYTNCHAWGYHQYAWYLRGHAMLTNCVAEGALTAQFNIEWHDVQINGGEMYWSGGVGAVGVRIGKTGSTAAKNTRIHGLHAFQGGSSRALSPVFDLENCGTGTIIEATAESTAAGVVFDDTVPTDAYVNVKATGGTTGSYLQVPQGATAGWTAGATDHGFKGWANDPAFNTSGIMHATGVGYFSKVYARGENLISSASVYVTGVGATLSNVGCALYDASGTLLTSSVDSNGATAAAFTGSTGLKTITFSTPQRITGPFYVLLWFTGTTMPGIIRQAGNANPVTNMNLATPNLRAGTKGSSLTTTPPADLTGQATTSAIMWVAVA